MKFLFKVTTKAPRESFESFSSVLMASAYRGFVGLIMLSCHVVKALNVSSSI